MKTTFPSLMMVALLALSACASPTDVGTTQPLSYDQAATLVAATMEAFPSNTPEPTAEPTCPEPTEGTQLLTNERYGYCLLYPAGYFQVGPLYGVAIAPEGFVFWETPGPVSIGVADATGLSASQWVDMQMVQVGGFGPERSSLILAKEEAILLPEVHGQASTREVIVVHEDRRYTLSFLLPDPGDTPAVEQFERLFSTVTGSFTFIPVIPHPPTTQASPVAGGSAVIVLVKDGNLLAWEEATGRIQTIFESGDVVQVELSDDGQKVAFLRRTLLDGDPRYGRSALWIVDRDGANPRELVSDEQLRAQLGASDTDDTNFAELGWVPNTHRLLYSVNFFPAYLWAQGLYLLDADTLAGAELVPVEEKVDFAPSPDGEHVAILFSTGPAFADVDDALAGNVVLTRPAGGVPGPYGDAFRPNAAIAWTQDSSALLIRGSSVFEGNATTRFTIWRVPVDGAPAQALTTLHGDGEQLAPDGSVVAFRRGTGGFGPGERFIVPLPEDLGPLAVVPDPLGLSWSPGSTAYVLGNEEMFPLCSNAAQATEICEPPVRFAEPLQWLEWIDRNRFLYLTFVPSRLMLGSVDGWAMQIAEDPQVPPNASLLTIAQSFDAVASTCIDDSEFVADVTVPDGTSFAANTAFRKTWRIRNTGDCAWDAAYRFTFLSGDRMSGPRSAPLGAAVQPGEEVELSVMLIAPETAGTHQGQWQLFASDGKPFGTKSYVVIVVP